MKFLCWFFNAAKPEYLKFLEKQSNKKLKSICYQTLEAYQENLNVIEQMRNAEVVNKRKLDQLSQEAGKLEILLRNPPQKRDFEKID